ncbi:RNA-directed DNA polymerase, eukaryota, reverse transcriptase zinc-binding domain protein [Tanacetum coccineum]
MTIAEYLEYEEIIKNRNFNGCQPDSTKAGVSAKHEDRVDPEHKNPDSPLIAKTNPYFQAQLSLDHPSIITTLTKNTRENEIIKEQEQGNKGLGDRLEAELEECWKIQQKRSNSHSDLRRQARDNAFRKWEAQIDQLKRQEHEVSECKMINTPKNEARRDETNQIHRVTSLPEKPNPGNITIHCSVNMFDINAIADLGASINIMSKSIFDELRLADKNTKTIIEMADRTRRVSQGIVENVLVRIDKFSFTSDFVIIDSKGSNNKIIILGRPFLANIRAEINFATKEVSLGIMEDRVKIKMNKHECNETTPASEHFKPAAQDKVRAYDVSRKTHWCEPIRQNHKTGYIIWASCDPYYEVCDGGGMSDKEVKHYWTCTNDDDRINLEWEGLSQTNWIRARYDNVNKEKWGETKTRAVIGAMVSKLPEEWFLGVSMDKDDLEGIIDYLEPTLYEWFVNLNDEAYKLRRNKLLGMPYKEPPPILIEEAEITRYNLGYGEVFTKTRILDVNKFPRTAPGIADIRAEIINSSFEDPSGTKRRHWCKPIYQWKDDICIKWASCNPYFDECDGGDNPRKNKDYWESNNDKKRTSLEWDDLSFDNWCRQTPGGIETSVQEIYRSLPIVKSLPPKGVKDGEREIEHKARAILKKGLPKIRGTGDEERNQRPQIGRKKLSNFSRKHPSAMASGELENRSDEEENEIRNRKFN